MNYCDEMENTLSNIWLIIHKWKNNLCPDCGEPIKSEKYFNRCSKKPYEHSLGDAIFYLKKINEVLEK